MLYNLGSDHILTEYKAIKMSIDLVWCALHNIDRQMWLLITSIQQFVDEALAQENIQVNVDGQGVSGPFATEFEKLFDSLPDEEPGNTVGDLQCSFTNRSDVEGTAVKHASRFIPLTSLSTPQSVISNGDKSENIVSHFRYNPSTSSHFVHVGKSNVHPMGQLEDGMQLSKASKSRKELHRDWNSPQRSSLIPVSPDLFSEFDSAPMAQNNSTSPTDLDKDDNIEEIDGSQWVASPQGPQSAESDIIQRSKFEGGIESLISKREGSFYPGGTRRKTCDSLENDDLLDFENDTLVPKQGMGSSVTEDKSINKKESAKPHSIDHTTEDDKKDSHVQNDVGEMPYQIPPITKPKRSKRKGTHVEHGYNRVEDQKQPTIKKKRILESDVIDVIDGTVDTAMGTNHSQYDPPGSVVIDEIEFPIKGDEYFPEVDAKAGDGGGLSKSQTIDYICEKLCGEADDALKAVIRSAADTVLQTITPSAATSGESNKGSKGADSKPIIQNNEPVSHGYSAISDRVKDSYSESSTENLIRPRNVDVSRNEASSCRGQRPDTPHSNNNSDVSNVELTTPSSCVNDEDTIIILEIVDKRKDREAMTDRGWLCVVSPPDKEEELPMSDSTETEAQLPADNIGTCPGENVYRQPRSCDKSGQRNNSHHIPGRSPLGDVSHVDMTTYITPDVPLCTKSMRTSDSGCTSVEEIVIDEDERKAVSRRLDFNMKGTLCDDKSLNSTDVTSNDVPETQRDMSDPHPPVERNPENDILRQSIDLLQNDNICDVGDLSNLSKDDENCMDGIITGDTVSSTGTPTSPTEIYYTDQRDADIEDYSQASIRPSSCLLRPQLVDKPSSCPVGKISGNSNEEDTCSRDVVNNCMDATHYVHQVMNHSLVTPCRAFTPYKLSQGAEKDKTLKSIGAEERKSRPSLVQKKPEPGRERVRTLQSAKNQTSFYHTVTTTVTTSHVCHQPSLGNVHSVRSRRNPLLWMPSSYHNQRYDYRPAHQTVPSTTSFSPGYPNRTGVSQSNQQTEAWQYGNYTNLRPDQPLYSSSTSPQNGYRYVHTARPLTRPGNYRQLLWPPRTCILAPNITSSNHLTLLEHRNHDLQSQQIHSEPPQHTGVWSTNPRYFHPFAPSQCLYGPLYSQALPRPTGHRSRPE